MKLFPVVFVTLGCIGVILCTILGGSFGVLLGLIISWLTLPYAAYILIPPERKL